MNDEMNSLKLVNLLQYTYTEIQNRMYHQYLRIITFDNSTDTPLRNGDVCSSSCDNDAAAVTTMQQLLGSGQLYHLYRAR